MAKDYYKILGINKDASKEAIKRAYRELAQKYHPDKAGGDEKKFKEINEAYQVLSDDKKRAQYDQFGAIFEQPGFDFSGFAGQGVNFEDLFRGFSGQGGDFSDIFGDIFSTFGGRGRARHYKTKARDISIDLELTLEDIYKGIKKDIKLQKLIKCPICKGGGGESGSSMKKCSVCKGSGEIHQTQRTFFGSFSQITTCSNCRGEGEIPEKICSKCRGRGVIKDTETITINIPFGVDDGQIIKFEGQGEAGKQGELPGDLYVKIHLKKHKDFIKKGDDIYYELPISFTQAVLGDKIEIPTLEKKVNLKIPAGIQSGKLIRIRGKGLSRAAGGRGDQFVKIQIETPQKISQKVKELLEKLKDEGI
jgi:molecular chaperone DnaJ